ncbi:MAG TPA: PIG-L deacetylase family protein [Gaiellaceae bacterium]|nr:PIG-L deacetylase family protein [Gaiellaceae bacterium]
MRALAFESSERLGTVLAIGCHADDIEIGCGGTILRLAELHPEAHVRWVVLSGDGGRAGEARRSAEDFLAGFASSEIVVEGFRDGFFPYEGGKVKEFFERLKGDVSPDLILTHQRADLHQDHRLVCELTWNTFRDHLIFEYEVPKYDGDFGSPNVFVHLSEAIAARKVELILSHFESQLDRRWFTDDLFHALLRLRGMESNAPERRAEAFYCRKLVI